MLLLGTASPSLGNSEDFGPRPSPDWTEALRAAVAPALAEFPGALALFVRDVATGEELALDADRPMYLSSAIKLVVMLEVLRQLDAGTLTLDERVDFGADDVRDGMHALAGTAPGTRFTVEQLLERMVAQSDNAAADLLITRVGVHNLNVNLLRRGVRFGPLHSLLEERRRIYGKLDPLGNGLPPADIQALGREDSLDTRAAELSRRLGQDPPWSGRDLHEAFLAYYAEHWNSAPMREVAELLTQLVRCEGLSPASCERAHALLEACETGARRIRAGLPPGARWAHKTGTQHLRACDVGILELQPGRPLVVAACTEDFRQLSQAERLLAEVGAAVARTWTAASARTAVAPGPLPDARIDPSPGLSHEVPP